MDFSDVFLAFLRVSSILQRLGAFLDALARFWMFFYGFGAQYSLVRVLGVAVNHHRLGLVPVPYSDRTDGHSQIFFNHQA